MSFSALHTTAVSGARRTGTEFEYARITLPRELPRNVVTRLLAERAEHGGWELDRLRLPPDGTRKVVLRRRIIRQRRAVYAAVS